MNAPNRIQALPYQYCRNEDEGQGSRACENHESGLGCMPRLCLIGMACTTCVEDDFPATASHHHGQATCRLAATSSSATGYPEMGAGAARVGKTSRQCLAVFPLEISSLAYLQFYYAHQISEGARSVNMLPLDLADLELNLGVPILHTLSHPQCEGKRHYTHAPGALPDA
eukprot:653609-Pelagomonas_calceolata.AAC.4